MRANSSANRPASVASGGWGGISSGFASKARSYKGTTSDEESEGEDRDVVTMDRHFHRHGDEKKEDIGHVSVSGPNPLKATTSSNLITSNSIDRAPAGDASPMSTEDNRHLRPPALDHDHDASSDEEHWHKIPGAFIWTPTKPKFKKLHPH
jgi:hypothetical protein